MSRSTQDPARCLLVSGTGLSPSPARLSCLFSYLPAHLLQSLPRCARTAVWALSFSLAATREIDFSFFSSPYLDVSVRAVPFIRLWIHLMMTGVLPAGFPHSDIHGSRDICSSPWLFAACRVLRRLLVPRHPPCALLCLTFAFFQAPAQYSVTKRRSVISCFVIFYQMTGFRCLDLCFRFNVQFSRYLFQLRAEWR